MFVADQNNCSITESVFVTEPEELSLSVGPLSNYNGFSTSCSGSNDGTLILDISGGSGPISLSYLDFDIRYFKWICSSRFN